MTSIDTEMNQGPTSDAPQEENPWEQWSDTRALFELTRGLRGDFQTSGSLAEANNVDLSRMTKSQKLIYIILHMLPSAETFKKLESDCQMELNRVGIELTQQKTFITDARRARYVLDEFSDAIILDPVDQPEHDDWCKSVDELTQFMSNLTREFGDFDTKLPRPSRYAPSNREVMKYCLNYIGPPDETDSSYSSGDFEPLMLGLVKKASVDEEWQNKVQSLEKKNHELSLANQKLQTEVTLSKNDRQAHIEGIEEENQRLKARIAELEQQRNSQSSASQPAGSDALMTDQSLQSTQGTSQQPTRSDLETLQQESSQFYELYLDAKADLEEAEKNANSGISETEYQRLQSQAQKLSDDCADMTATVDKLRQSLTSTASSWFALCKSLFVNNEESITSVACVIQQLLPPFASVKNFSVTDKVMSSQWAPSGFLDADVGYPTDLSKSQLIAFVMDASTVTAFQFLAWVDERFLSAPQTLNDNTLLVMVAVYRLCSHEDWYTRSFAISCFSILYTKFTMKEPANDKLLKLELFRKHPQLAQDHIAIACFMRIRGFFVDEYANFFQPFVGPLQLRDLARDDPLRDYVEVIATTQPDDSYLSTRVDNFEIRLVRAPDGQEILWVNDRSAGWKCSVPGFTFKFEVTAAAQPNKIKLSWNDQGGSVVVDVGDGSPLVGYLLAHHSGDIDTARRLARSRPGRWTSFMKSVGLRR
ncbi:hypothetical protein KCU93_g9441, partial [Aureobasidium melanogenum]